jgi:hypothetical protein
MRLAGGEVQVETPSRAEGSLEEISQTARRGDGGSQDTPGLLFHGHSFPRSALLEALVRLIVKSTDG